MEPKFIRFKKDIAFENIFCYYATALLVSLVFKLRFYNAESGDMM